MPSEGHDRPHGQSRQVTPSFNSATVPIALTASDERFARTLWQFLSSVKRRGLQDRCRWIVYDLGLGPETLARLQKNFPWSIFKRFAFESWPAHLGLSFRNYAWKPALVAGEVLDSQGVVLWFDCATLFRGSPDQAIAAARADGLWYLRGQTPLYRHADKRSLDAMAVPLEVRHLSECVTGALAFDAANPIARRIVAEWRDWALQAEVIAPDGAGLATHKFDQALLSGIIFKAVRAGALPLNADEIDISSSHPVRWMTSRNKISPIVPRWLDWPARVYYGVYKWLDIRWLGTSRWMKPRIGGLRRHLVEHFTVSVTDKRSGNARALPSPRYGYLADPFIWANSTGVWVFAEEFRCAEERGTLVALELEPDLSVRRKVDLTTVGPEAALDCHASFPFLFEDQGRTYMIPETSQRRTLDLYECETWPDRWRLARRLILDIDAADTMAIRFNGRWWLFTSVREAGDGRHLAIYSCVDIARDPLVAHPINARRLDAAAPFGTGRNAGLFEPMGDGTLHRFVQKSTRHYGQGGGFRRILRLDAECFEEEEVTLNPELVPTKGSETGCHHLSVSGHYAASDRRVRAGYLDFLLRRR